MKTFVTAGIIATSISSAFAQTTQGGSQLLNLLGLAHRLVSDAVPFLIGVTMVVFFYGLITFIVKGKEGGETLEKSKQYMMYSLLAIFVMVSIWGIVAFLQNLIGIDPNATVKPPIVPPLR